MATAALEETTALFHELRQVGVPFSMPCAQLSCQGDCTYDTCPNNGSSSCPGEIRTVSITHLAKVLLGAEVKSAFR